MIKTPTLFVQCLSLSNGFILHTYASTAFKTTKEFVQRKNVLMASAHFFYFCGRVSFCNLQLSEYNFTSVACEKSASNLTIPQVLSWVPTSSKIVLTGPLWKRFYTN